MNMLQSKLKSNGWPYLVGLCTVMLFLNTGCRILNSKESDTDNAMVRFFPGGRKTQPEPGELQQSLLQFAGAYSLRVVESIDELENVDDSPFTSEEALRLKIAKVSSIISISTGENPNLNLVNLIAMTSLSRMALEDQSELLPQGPLFDSWLERASSLENKIWRIADEVLSKEQKDELRTEIEHHYQSRKKTDGFSILQTEDILLEKHLKKNGDEHSVFNLAAINPLSGLDPTVREITQTRLFAERGLFTMQWMPWLLRWQSELLLLEASNQPEVAQALEDVTSLSASIERASQAAESLSQTAAGLPDQLSSERQAIVEALDDQEQQITSMLEAGTEMSDSLNTTIVSLDALMKRFGVGEPKPPRDPNRKRFDILDYATTADSFTAMAEQLNATLEELNATLDSPALDRISNQTTHDMRSVLNHLFLLAAGLVLLITACALGFRKITRSGPGAKGAGEIE